MSGSVAVLGSGAWGTALAAHCRRAGHDVRQWVREPEVAAQIVARENRAFLAGVELPDGICASSSLEDCVTNATLVLAVIPSQFARAVYSRIGELLPAGVPCVAAAKGIEDVTLMLPTDVLRDALGVERPVAVLSGPSFAHDVAIGKPTALVIAAERPALADRIQAQLATSELRVYTNDDPVGVQVGGALKNVIALASGILDGLGTGPNGRAALITRGLAEMTRLGCKLGGRAETFAGLAGLGDLVLTCTAEQSRNYSVGQRIGRGESLKTIIEGSTSVAEGVATTHSAHALASRESVPMPIVREVHRILYEGGDAAAAIRRLMDRPLTSELDSARPVEP